MVTDIFWSIKWFHIEILRIRDEPKFFKTVWVDQIMTVKVSVTLYIFLNEKFFGIGALFCNFHPFRWWPGKPHVQLWRPGEVGQIFLCWSSFSARCHPLHGVCSQVCHIYFGWRFVLFFFALKLLSKELLRLVVLIQHPSTILLAVPSGIGSSVRHHLWNHWPNFYSGPHETCIRYWNCLLSVIYKLQ